MFGFATIKYYGSTAFNFLLPSSWRRDFVSNAQGNPVRGDDQANDVPFARWFSPTFVTDLFSRGRARVGSATARLLASSTAVLAVLNATMGIGLIFWGKGASYALDFAMAGFVVTVGIAQILHVVHRGIRALSALYADIQSIVETVNSLQAVLEKQNKDLKDMRELLCDQEIKITHLADFALDELDFRDKTRGMFQQQDQTLQSIIGAQKNLTLQVQSFEQKVARQLDTLTNDLTLEMHEMGTVLNKIPTLLTHFSEVHDSALDTLTNDLTLEMHEMGTVLNKIPTLLTHFSEVHDSANDDTTSGTVEDLTEAEMAALNASRKTV